MPLCPSAMHDAGSYEMITSAPAKISGRKKCEVPHTPTPGVFSVGELHSAKSFGLCIKQELKKRQRLDIIDSHMPESKISRKDQSNVREVLCGSTTQTAFEKVPPTISISTPVL
jgi:hypothetical protein